MNLVGLAAILFGVILIVFGYSALGSLRATGSKRCFECKREDGEFREVHANVFVGPTYFCNECDQKWYGQKSNNPKDWLRIGNGALLYDPPKGVHKI